MNATLYYPANELFTLSYAQEFWNKICKIYKTWKFMGPYCFIKHLNVLNNSNALLFEKSLIFRWYAYQPSIVIFVPVITTFWLLVQTVSELFSIWKKIWNGKTRKRENENEMKSFIEITRKLEDVCIWIIYMEKVVGV